VVDGATVEPTDESATMCDRAHVFRNWCWPGPPAPAETVAVGAARWRRARIAWPARLA